MHHLPLDADNQVERALERAFFQPPIVARGKRFALNVDYLGVSPLAQREQSGKAKKSKSWQKAH
jgi:hypothetical protein